MALTAGQGPQDRAAGAEPDVQRAGSVRFPPTATGWPTSPTSPDRTKFTCGRSPTLIAGAGRCPRWVGTQPLWARNGQELFYVALDGALMRVPIEQGSARPEAGAQAWWAGTPVKLFENTYAWTMSGFTGRSYDISPDGRRFLAIKLASEQTSAPNNLVVVQNLLLVT